MTMHDIIVKKRDGGELTEREINYIINSNAPDYQLSALLMAVYFKGLNKSETINLTKSMIKSGETLDLSGIDGIKADKHSTGGVGDKTSLIVGPIVAAMGIPFVKMSGRGLGHTGGTIDKLESINGFNVNPVNIISQIKDIQMSITSQNKNLVPADKKLYELRNLTATVENKSLIAASIMSKKIAGGADCILLDVKTGNGAFMETLEDATMLSNIMIDIGKANGKNITAIITDMSQPLGNKIGNRLEIIEVIDTLNNKGSSDLEEICIEFSAHIALMAKKANNIESARQCAYDVLRSGRALSKFKEFIEYQGGKLNELSYEPAKYKKDVYIENGFISEINTKLLGMISTRLGAGKLNRNDNIDYDAGIIIHKKIGQKVYNEPVLTLYSNSPINDSITIEASTAFEISDTRCINGSLIKSVIIA